MPHSSLHKYTRNRGSTFFSTFSREELLVLLLGLAWPFCARKGMHLATEAEKNILFQECKLKIDTSYFVYTILCIYFYPPIPYKEHWIYEYLTISQ